MKQELKDKIGSTEKLQELLGISRTQSWRLWNGKSKLTSTNLELIEFKLGILDKAVSKRDEAADLWINEKFESLKEQFGEGKVIRETRLDMNEKTCIVSVLDSQDDMAMVDELFKLIQNTEHYYISEILKSALSEVIDDYAFETKTFLTKDYK